MKLTKEPEKSGSFYSLFRYATFLDYFMFLIAFLSCVIRACMTPVCIVAYGEIIAMLVDRNRVIGVTSKSLIMPIFGGGKILVNGTKEENMAELRNDSWSFGISMSIIALATFISGMLYVDLTNKISLRIILKMRQKFFEATIRKDIGWHDVTSNQNFAVFMTDNIEKIREGIAEKFGHFVQLCVSVLVIIIIAFCYGWKLTLAISAHIPIIIVANYFIAKYQSKLTIREQNSYGIAGRLVEEVIGAVRTVVAFGGEKLESDRFDEYLVPARKTSKWKGACSGAGEALAKAMQFIFGAIAFWYGINLVLADRDKIDQEYTPAILMIAFFSISIGADHIARCSTFLDSMATAAGSVVPIYEVIDSRSTIDPVSSNGITPEYGLKGNIEFHDVIFKYPSRDDIVVLNGLHIKIAAGQTVALVGNSGCGKSTCLQLLQRFYDPVFGSVNMDNIDIRQYNVSWLRSNIAIVGQEPVLFQGSIGENIRYGKPGATPKEIEDAAKSAGAHDFIIELPNSYATLINEGLQLSGGQKQRIAIARALIQNPKILLLDEATSALDYNSEKVVQKALNAACKGRTTIVVSHRLSAIKNSDRIVFIHEGKAVEEGSHDDLMDMRGKYFDMVTAHKRDDVIDGNEHDKLKKDKSFEISFNQSHRSMKKTSLDKHRSSSVSKNDINQEDTIQKHMKFVKTFIRVLKVARQEWCFLFCGAICAALYGCSQPAYAFLFGEFFEALAQTDPAEVQKRTSDLAIICLLVGLGAGATCFIQSYLFNLAGSGLTTKFRSLTFKAILSQEMGWFDEEHNTVGALSARLSGEAASVQGSIGYPLSGLIQAFANFIFSVSLAFKYSWEIAIACLLTAPLMIVSIVFEARFMAKSSDLEKRVLEETSRIATEAIANIRTIAGLRREPQLIKDYNNEVEKYGSQIRKKLRFRGVVNSSSWGIMYFGYAVSVTYGGLLCSEGKIEFQNVIKVSESMLYGLMVLALALALTPSFTTALIAANRLFKIMDRKPLIKSSNQYENTLIIEKPVNEVTYNDVTFRYPTRPDVKVLNHLNFSVMQGKTVALVGASGCGKSTCIQLLLRYYDAEGGKIYIDGQDIKRDLGLQTVRRRLGIVSQEPVLFEKTIAENIAYGNIYRKVTMTEIIDAAKLANAYSFVANLPKGFETKLGARGTQLSGGQKQRIAIARALIRDPQVLLLDEATSALDSQSEKIVQLALDTACSGRTCIVVAHRLSTIQNADLICVLENGRIAEQGSHSQLLASDGIYAKLYKNQPSVS